MKTEFSKKLRNQTNLVRLEPNAQSGMVGAILAFGWFAEGGC